MSWFSNLSAICMCFSTRCRVKSFHQERESTVVQLISYYSIQPDKSSFAFSLNHTTCDLRERNLTRSASQLTIFVNCEMSLCLCEKTQLSQLIHFSLTARFLSVYVKKTNLTVNHFSLSTRFFQICLAYHEFHYCRKRITRQIQVSGTVDHCTCQQRKKFISTIAFLNEPRESLKKEDKKRITEAKLITLQKFVTLPYSQHLFII